MKWPLQLQLRCPFITISFEFKLYAGISRIHCPTFIDSIMIAIIMIIDYHDGILAMPVLYTPKRILVRFDSPYSEMQVCNIYKTETVHVRYSSLRAVYRAYSSILRCSQILWVCMSCAWTLRISAQWYSGDLWSVVRDWNFTWRNDFVSERLSKEDRKSYGQPIVRSLP